MKKTFVVTPVANEESTILQQIERLEALKIAHLEIVFVMDRSSHDQTRAIISRKARNVPWIHLYDFQASTGVVSCYLAGLRYALERGADQVIEMDAGLSHDPDCIPQFLSKLEEGYDCVFGSRFMPGGSTAGVPWYRCALSRLGTLLANFILGTSLTDMTSGFEAFRREVLDRLNLEGFLSVKTTHFFQTEMRYYCHNLKIAEIPIVYRYTSTSLSLKSVMRSLRVLWRLRQAVENKL
jgi:dolichol-phosphate mannosyltransferase